MARRRPGRAQQRIQNMQRKYIFEYCYKRTHYPRFDITNVARITRNEFRETIKLSYPGNKQEQLNKSIFTLPPFFSVLIALKCLDSAAFVSAKQRSEQKIIHFNLFLQSCAFCSNMLNIIFFYSHLIMHIERYYFISPNLFGQNSFNVHFSLWHSSRRQRFLLMNLRWPRSC